MRKWTEVCWQLERNKRTMACCNSNGRGPPAFTMVTFLTGLVCCSLLYVTLRDMSQNVSASPSFNFPDELPAVGRRSRSSSSDDNIVPNGILDSGLDSSFQAGSEGRFPDPSRSNRLEHIFKQVDRDKDGMLSEAEIIRWINDGIRAHFSTAMKNNFENFFRVDKNPRNGLITWNEFLEHFSQQNGLKTKITMDDIQKKTPTFTKLPRDIKVEIARLEASWSESALNNPDFLTVDEYLAFTHPEASPTRLLTLVQDTFATFDLDGDGIITQTEFDTTYRDAEGVDRVYKDDLALLDKDHNGRISRVELMTYMDPRNIHHSEKDARKLIKAVDSDQDGKLSLAELKEKLDVVMKSKLYDVAKNLHNFE